MFQFKLNLIFNENETLRKETEMFFFLPKQINIFFDVDFRQKQNFKTGIAKKIQCRLAMKNGSIWNIGAVVVVVCSDVRGRLAASMENNMEYSQ